MGGERGNVSLSLGFSWAIRHGETGSRESVQDRAACSRRQGALQDRPCLLPEPVA